MSMLSLCVYFDLYVCTALKYSGRTVQWWATQVTNTTVRWQVRPMRSLFIVDVQDGSNHFRIKFLYKKLSLDKSYSNHLWSLCEEMKQGSPSYDIHQTQNQTQLKECVFVGSGCGSVGRAVASYTRDPWIKLSHRRVYKEH